MADELNLPHASSRRRSGRSASGSAGAWALARAATRAGGSRARSPGAARRRCRRASRAARCRWTSATPKQRGNTSADAMPIGPVPHVLAAGRPARPRAPVLGRRHDQHRGDGREGPAQEHEGRRQGARLRRTDEEALRHRAGLCVRAREDHGGRRSATALEEPKDPRKKKSKAKAKPLAAERA